MDEQEYRQATTAQKAIAAVLVVIILVGIYLLLSGLYSFFFGAVTDDTPEYEREEIREKMEEHLYEKYGEEFVVNRIGTRRFRDTTFYQGQIYPKRFIGTNKQGDEYYQAEVNIDILESGQLRDPGDTYGRVIARKRAEEFLMPKVQEIFGERVKLKPGIRHLRTNPNEEFVGYLTPDFEDALERSIEDPENNRLKFDLDVYIFDRIADEQEKEERREDIFEFVQYLQDEGLFEYLEMRIVFVDERVLADSYDDYEREVRLSDKERVYIEEEDKTVELPPGELREEMSRKLQAEVDEMSEQELLASMREIRKDELNYDGIGQWSSHYHSLIYSKGMVKERYTSSYDEDSDVVRSYKEIDDVRMGPNLEYIYK